jgi:hypothetical protein
MLGRSLARRALGQGLAITYDRPEQLKIPGRVGIPQSVVENLVSQRSADVAGDTVMGEFDLRLSPLTRYVR